jgi:RNA-directed DNA polymerase
MRRFLLAWQRWENRLQAFVCAYADDLVILCRGTAEQALTVTRDLMRRIKLELNEEKTRIINAQMESFDFLGYTFGPMHNTKNGARYLGAAPSKARVRRLRQVVHRYLSPHNQSPVDEVVAHLNRLLVGWGNFFRYGTVSKTYRQIDRYVADRLRAFLVRRHKVRNHGTRRFSNQRLYDEYGLRPLAPLACVVTS